MGSSNQQWIRQVVGRVSSGAVRLVTLDVFDTLLFRTVPTPADVFPLVGEALADQGLLAREVDATTFAILRAQAEVRARQVRKATGGETEVTLAEIYHEMVPAIVAADQVDAAVAAEVAVERSVTVPDLGIAELARAAAAAGATVVAVSDTYFSAGQVAALLERPELPPGVIAHVFTSSDHRQGKADGLLKAVLAAQGVDAALAVHIGDNPGADVAAAEEAGMGAIGYRPPGSFAPPVATGLAAPGDGGVSALRRQLGFAGTDTLPASLLPYWRLGATEFGPALVGFAEWVVTGAAAAGIDRVFPLMREGGLLAELIDEAARQRGVTLTATPMWLSRSIAWRASLLSGATDELEGAVQRRTRPTPREILVALGLDGDDAAAAGIGAGQMDDRAASRSFIEALGSSPELRLKILGVAEDRRRRLLAYVRRITDDCPTIALVDLGWGASIQAGLESILVAVGSTQRVTGSYLVTNRVAAGRALQGSSIASFLGTFGEPADLLEPIVRSPEILEQACMPPVGSLGGFTEDGEPIVPPNPITGIQPQQVAAVQQGMRDYQALVGVYRAAGHPVDPAASPDLLLRILHRLVADPSPDEALLLGSWVHDEGLGSDRVEHIVAPEGVRALRHADAATLDPARFPDVYWPQGAVALAQRAPSERRVGRVEIAAVSVGGGDELVDGVDLVANDLGLVLARTALSRRRLGSVVVRPQIGAGILRVDALTLTLSLVGKTAPLVYRVPLSESDPRVELRGITAAGGDVLVVHGPGAEIVVDVAEVAGAAAGEVYGVQAELLAAAVSLPGDVAADFARAGRPRTRGQADRGRIRFDLFVDSGAGFTEAEKASGVFAADGGGLVRAALRIVQPGLLRLRVDPADEAGVFEFRRLAVTLLFSGSSEPVVVDTLPGKAGPWTLIGLHEVGDGVLVADGQDPQLHLDLAGRAEETPIAAEVDAEFVFRAGTVNPRQPRPRPDQPTRREKGSGRRKG